MAEGLFNLLMILPLPIWASMLLFPRARFTQNLVMAYWPYMVLGALYLLFLLAALASGSMSDLGFSFTALQRGFANDWAFLAAWAHMITFDVFIGVWIFRDAKYGGLNPGLYLLLTFIAGPLGLASYLLVRSRKNKTDPVRIVN